MRRSGRFVAAERVFFLNNGAGAHDIHENGDKQDDNVVDIDVGFIFDAGDIQLVGIREEPQGDAYTLKRPVLSAKNNAITSPQTWKMKFPRDPHNFPAAQVGRGTFNGESICRVAK